MADSVIMADAEMPSLEEIQTMKVADLRKKLKAFGLLTTGNKTELVDRLQEACIALNKGDSFDNSQFGFDESQISELDGVDGNTTIEDSALLDQDQLSLYVNSSSLEDSKVLEDSESHFSSSSVTMPPKKRTLRKTAREEGTVVEKKVTINRTNVTNVDFNIKPTTELKTETAVSNKSEADEKKVISVKNMTAAERLAMRAKRFNTSNTVVTTNSSKLTSNRNSKQSIISSAVAPDLDILKKRAERFGQSVSTVMKQIEQKEKLLKRKCKFGASISATSNIDEQEKKRRRAERFGIS